MFFLPQLAAQAREVDGFSVYRATNIETRVTGVVLAESFRIVDPTNDHLTTTNDHLTTSC
jgi:hypothetical protein